MVNLEYVKKRKRRKLVAIITAISSMCVAVVAIVSFLGRYVGTFTVSLHTGNVKLSLSEIGTFDTQDTTTSSYLVVDELPPFTESYFDNVVSRGHNLIDNNETTYEDVGMVDKSITSKDVLSFFKYTFSVKNTGTVYAGYNFYLRITESINGKELLDIMRVAIYINDGKTDNHKFETYARMSDEENKYIDENGELQVTYREYLSPKKGQTEFLESDMVDRMFYDEDNNIIAHLPVRNFKPDDINRYTIVLWLEGNDPQCKNEAPEGATIKLGVEINAYEDEND